MKIIAISDLHGNLIKNIDPVKDALPIKLNDPLISAEPVKGNEPAGPIGPVDPTGPVRIWTTEVRGWVISI
jgi:hypothetical protein